MRLEFRVLHRDGKLTRSAGLALLTLSGFALSACYTTDIERVAQTATTGIADPYDKALTEEYQALARYEARQMYDWPDATHFARKGLQAAAGGEPVPERTVAWKLAFNQDRLNDARNRLAALISAGAKQSHPAEAARAQAAFDCWVEQVEEGWQMDHIARCHGRFERSAIELERGIGQPQMVHFDLNSADLTPEAWAEIGRIAAEAARYGAPQATVIGHADASGAPAHNLKLSLRRAEAVRDALSAAGLDKGRIALSAYGEQRLLFSGAANAPDARNRRVEVIFLPSNTL